MGLSYKKLYILAILPLALNATTLKELINSSLKENNAIKANRYIIKSKQQNLKSVSNIYSPTLNLGASLNRLDLDTRAIQVKTTASGYIKLDLNLYDGGKSKAIKKEALHQLKSSKYSAKNSEKEIILQIITIFYQIKTIEKNISAYQNKSKSLFAQYLKQKQKYKLKMVTEDEVLKLYSEYESNNYTIEDLKYQKSSLLQNLSLLTGKKIINLSDFRFPKINILHYKTSSYIKSLQENILAAKESINSISSIKKPKIKLEDTLSIYAYDDYNKMLLKDLPDKQNQLMLNFSINIFDTSTKAKKESARLSKLAQSEQLSYELKKEKLAFYLARKKLLTQKAKIASAKSALEMAKTVYKIILTKYQNGIVDNIAYLDALSKKTINQALYDQALYNYEIAKANYYFSGGEEYEKILKKIFK